MDDETVKKADKKPKSSSSTAVKPGRRHDPSRAGLRTPLGYPLALSEIPLFEPLSQRHLRRVAELAVARRYKDEVVVREGDPGDGFYVVLDGRARLEAPGQPVQRLFPGSSFGELALLDDAPRAATVAAEGELLVAYIPRSDFLRLVDKEPGMDFALISALVRMIREMQKRAEPGAVLAGYYALDEARARDASRVAGVSSPGWLSAMNHAPLFSELQGRQLGKAMKLADFRRYGTGSVLVRTGAPGDAFHVILDGRARVETPEGHERILQPGDSFGELALIDNASRAATVTAIDDVTTLRLKRAAFVKLVKAEPAIAKGVLRGLVRTVRDIEAVAPGAGHD